jgi:O-antigen/teichoic acid export membrane protein
MNLVQRVAKNTLSLILASVISMVLGLFYGIYTARYLGPERYGTISFAIAFIGLFSVLTDIGIQQLALREIARDKSLVGKYLGNIAVLKVFLTIIAFGLIALTINLLKYPDPTVKVVYLIALSTVLSAFSGMFNSVFQAFEKMEYSSIGSILNSASMLAGGLLAIYYGLSIMGFALIYVFSNAIGLIYNVIIARRLGITPRLQVDYGFIKSLVRRALPFGIGGLFLVYYVWMARVMLSVMVNNEAVGYYSAAYNLMASLNFVPSAFVLSLFPLMAIFFKGSDKSLDKVFRLGIKYMYMLALPMAVGVTLLAKEIIALIYGPKFLPSAMALEILIWAEFFIFIDVLLSQMLLSINKENITMINAGLGAALNIGLNLVLIPRLGIEGSALATLATEFYFFVISFIILKRYGHSVDLRNLLFKPLIATSIMALFITTFSRLHLFMLIPISAALYFAVLYLIRYVSDEDISLIKQALAIRKLRSTA